MREFGVLREANLATTTQREKCTGSKEKKKSDLKLKVFLSTKTNVLYRLDKEGRAQDTDDQRTETP